MGCDLEASPALKETTLLKEIQAPIIADGKQIGTMSLPAGSSVAVVAIESDGVMVSRGEGVPFKVSKDVLPSEITTATTTVAIKATPTPKPISVTAAATVIASSPVPSASPVKPPTIDWDAGPILGAALDQAKFRWWSPPGEKKLSGVVVLVNGRNMEGRDLINDPDWQKLATEMKLGLMGCFFFGGKDYYTYQNDPTGDLDRTINKAVDELAAKNGYPDLKSPPLIFWGHSAGANVNAIYGGRYPERVVAAINLKGPFGPGNTSYAKNEVPYLVITGAKDKPDWVKGATSNFEAGHKDHALWTRAFTPNEGHEPGKSRALIMSFLRAVIPQRLGNSSSSLKRLSDSDGWLGNPKTYEIFSSSQYIGNRSEGIWLPDEATAKEWQKFITVK